MYTFLNGNSKLLTVNIVSETGKILWGFWHGRPSAPYFLTPVSMTFPELLRTDSNGCQSGNGEDEQTEEMEGQPQKQAVQFWARFWFHLKG